MPHSPEVLRAFYLIALNKDRDTSDSLAYRDEYGIVVDDAVSLSRDRLPVSTLPGQSPRFEQAEHTNKGEAALVAGKDNDSWEFNFGQTEIGASGLRSILKKSLVARNDSACQQCRLCGFQCDLQKPSCWKCQRYSLPCHYEVEDAEDYQQVEPAVDSEDEPTSWQDSVRVNPYYNLEGKGKLCRIDRQFLQPRPSRLSKPMREKRVRYETKEDEETLLEGFSPTISQVDTTLGSASPTPSEVDTALRSASPTPSEVDMTWPTTSPTTFELKMASRTTSSTSAGFEIAPRTGSSTGCVGSELVRPSHRLKSSVDSGFTTSVASAQSRPTESSPRPSLSIWTSPPTTGASSAWLPQKVEVPSDKAPKQFWCTFCLNQCNDQKEWELHEWIQHFPKEIWICMPHGAIEKLDGNDVCVFCDVIDPDLDHSSEHTVQPCNNEKRTFVSQDALQQHLATVHHQTGMARKMQKWSRPPEDNEWYWNCGFCDILLSSWADRVAHVSAHFNEGTVMYCWDPLTPSYPLDRTTMHCAAGFPLGWDTTRLWDLERERCGSSSIRVYEEHNRCKQCDINVYFGNEADVKRHENIWHSRREVWSCHMMKNVEADILAPYFFPSGRQASDYGTCPYCDTQFAVLAESYPSLDMCDIHIQHLEDDHNLNGCEPSCVYTRSGNLLLHLANIHNVTLNEMTLEVLECCRKDERPLARNMNCPQSSTMVK